MEKEHYECRKGFRKDIICILTGIRFGMECLNHSFLRHVLDYFSIDFFLLAFSFHSSSPWTLLISFSQSQHLPSLSCTNYLLQSIFMNLNLFNSTTVPSGWHPNLSVCLYWLYSTLAPFFLYGLSYQTKTVGRQNANIANNCRWQEWEISTIQLASWCGQVNQIPIMVNPTNPNLQSNVNQGEIVDLAYLDHKINHSSSIYWELTQTRRDRKLHTKQFIWETKKSILPRRSIARL